MKRDHTILDLTVMTLCALAILFCAVAVAFGDDPVPSPIINPQPDPNVPPGQLPKQPPVIDAPPPGAVNPAGGGIKPPVDTPPPGSLATVQFSTDAAIYNQLANINQATAIAETQALLRSYGIWTKKSPILIVQTISQGRTCRIEAQWHMGKGYGYLAQEHVALVKGDFVKAQKSSVLCGKAFNQALQFFALANQCYANAQSLMNKASNPPGH